MNVLHLKQGSQEWLEARAGRVTASNFSKVLAKGQGKTRRSYMLQCLAERLTKTPVETFTSPAMEWGTEHEPQARAIYELTTGVAVEEVGMVLRGDDIACSPDGLIGTDGGLEIKCPNTTTHIETMLSGKLPSIHVAQVQGCLWVTERSWWDFVSFDPRLTDANQMFVLRVERDDDYIAGLEKATASFIAELLEIEAKLRKPLPKPEAA